MKQKWGWLDIMISIDNLAKELTTELKDYFVNDYVTPKVSVVVPCYNVEKYLVKCLNSIIKQTLKNIEIICVDDGSNDLTPDILKIYENLDKRVKVITQKNQKLGAARNNGFAQAKGEYVGFVDSDDWIDVNYYDKLYTAAKKYDSDIALADYVRIGNGKTKKRLNITKEDVFTTVEAKFQGCRQAKHPCSTNKIYRVEFLKKHELSFPVGVICEDKIFVCKAVYYANSVVSVPDTYYFYYRRPNSIVHTKNEFYEQGKIEANRDVLAFLRENRVKLLRDDFWAIKKMYKIFGHKCYVVKESLKKEKHLLFGFIPVFQKNLT